MFSVMADSLYDGVLMKYGNNDEHGHRRRGNGRPSPADNERLTLICPYSAFPVPRWIVAALFIDT